MSGNESTRPETAGDGTPDDWIPRQREESLCPCKSRSSYASCCMPFHHGKARCTTAEQLMRSRYSAYFFRRVDYLVETTHPATRVPSLKRDLEENVYQVRWSFLTILGTARGGAADKAGKVEFIAEYYVDGEKHDLHEISRFKRHKGAWKYLDGKA